MICGVGDKWLNPSVIDNAILYAAEEGANVIQINAEIGYSQRIEDAINAASNDGVFIVCASGNSNLGSVSFPANAENCFAVGASTKKANEGDPIKRKSNSNYGDDLMLVAPGEYIKSTYNNNMYGTMDQTSTAAPQVSATAGLILSRFPDFTDDDIAEVLCITAMKLPYYDFTEGYEYGSWNIKVGYGKLNANRALGIIDDISSNLTLKEGNYIVDEVHVTNNSTLTLAENSRFYLLKPDSKLIIDEGSTLIIENDATIFGDSPNNITVNGNIQVGTDVTFQKNDNGSNPFYGLVLSNSQMITNLDQVTFNETQLHNYGAELNITHSNFIDCFVIYSYSGNVTVSNNTNFTNTWLYLENQTGNPNYIASVENSIFTTEFINVGIDILNYDNFSIEGNTIIGHNNGIQLWYSGGASLTNQNISNNEIYNCAWSGIMTYNSTVYFFENHLHNNQVGVKLFNNSNNAFFGNYEAETNDETNFLTDNGSYELYASPGSFPWYFRYNVIIDEDNLGNPTDPMIYWEAPPPPIPLKDIRYNCWGTNFDPEEDLYPGFMVYPTWCPGEGGNKSSEIALQTFLDGKEHFENEEYADAESTFESVIELYPVTQYASTAMKELFALEKFTDNDYNTLKQYYETNDSIQVDTVLTKLATFLANKCEIEMENWQTAIDHYEDIIDNPETTADSIFAIIDLGYTYFLMGDSTNRSVAQGKMLEHIPTSKEEFAEKRNYLLSLLPITKTQQAADNMLETLKAGELLQNVPNPFSNTTTVYYKLNEQSSVLFKVYDHIGKEVRIIDQSTKDKGINKIELDMSGFSSGIYFYSLFINGQLSDTKKMVVK